MWDPWGLGWGVPSLRAGMALCGSEPVLFSGGLADEAGGIVSCEGNLLVMKGSACLGVHAAIVVDYASRSRTSG